MDVDPRTNVVVFQVNIPEVPHPVGQAPTRADDGIRQAWEAAVRDDRATPEYVTALHTEWEPTPTDTTYITATFPNAEVAYNFTRPAEEGWEEALAAAGEALRAAAAREAELEAAAGPSGDAGQGGGSAAEGSSGLEGGAGPEGSAAPEGGAGPEGSAAPEGGAGPEGSAAPESRSTPESRLPPGAGPGPEGGSGPGAGLGPEVADSEAGAAGSPAAGGLGQVAGQADVAGAEPQAGREAGTRAGAANAGAGEVEPSDSDGPGHETGTASSDAGDVEPRNGDELEPPAATASSDAAVAKPRDNDQPPAATASPDAAVAKPRNNDQPPAATASPDPAVAKSLSGDGTGLGAAGLGGGAAAPVVSGELVPMLWSESSPLGLGLGDVPHWPVVGGRLHLGLAVVIHTRRGTDSVYPVTYDQVGEHSFDVVMAEACEVLAGGFEVGARETDRGRLFYLSGTLVAAAVCLPAFYRRLSGRIETDRLVVGVSSQDEVFVAAAGGSLAGVVEQLVHESPHPDTEVVPTLLQVTAAGVQFVSERARP